MLNAPGTIDADYRGEILVILINHGSVTFEVTRGTRIAQLVIAPVLRAKLTEAVSLDETERKTGGFGSTGMATSRNGESNYTQRLADLGRKIITVQVEPIPAR